MSAPVWVGLLSTVGLAMQTGVVMVVYIDEAFQRRVREGRLRSREDIIEAHAEGTVQRLRPKVMTITTMAVGLLPLLWSDGAGAEIMKRVAAPMLGGLLTSAFLTLEVIPVLYTIWRDASASVGAEGRSAYRSGFSAERTSSGSDWPRCTLTYYAALTARGWSKWRRTCSTRRTGFCSKKPGSAHRSKRLWAVPEVGPAPAASPSVALLDWRVHTRGVSV